MWGEHVVLALFPGSPLASVFIFLLEQEKRLRTRLILYLVEGGGGGGGGEYTYCYAHGMLIIVFSSFHSCVCMWGGVGRGDDMYTN